MAGGALIVYQWALARPLWLDEEMIALNLRERGLLGLVGRLSPEMVAPYGWLVVERLALVAFGTGEQVLRFFPMLFGLATIATALWIGGRWLNAAGASILVLLCSFGQWITYFDVELKHYSADACLALLLPALAAGAIELGADTDVGPGSDAGPTRVGPPYACRYPYLYWWIVAAVGQLFANGALFVTPACAVVIVTIAIRRGGPRAALRAAVPGIVWLAAFAVNYMVTLRHAQGSEFLQGYWTFAFPPESAGTFGTVRWIGERLLPFAEKPGGAGFGVLFWIASIGGFAVASGSQRLLALTCATVPLSAFVLAAVRVVPFFERLVLWVVPALYVGIALLGDRSVAALRSVGAIRSAGVIRLKPDPTDAASGFGTPIQIVALLIVVAVCGDITYHGLDDLRARPKNANHQLDDRAAVRWLAAQQRPGDVWMTTRLALPALWWYRDSGADTILEAKYAPPGPDCRPGELRDTVKGSRRVVVYFGFRFDDVPRGFDDLLLERLGDIGSLVGYRPFAQMSRAVIVDLTEPSRHDRNAPVRPDATGEDLRIKPDGCIAVQPARR